MNDWNDAERRVERAQELFEQHKWQEALEELRAATSINPYNASWFFNIGLTLDELGRFEEALRTFERLESLDPTFEPSYCGRILTYTELGEHDRAEEMFYLARLYKEHCDDCFYNMGISLSAR